MSGDDRAPSARWAWERALRSRGEFSLTQIGAAMMLATYADRHGVCYPRQSVVYEGCSRESINRNLQPLIKAGWLKAERGWRRGMPDGVQFHYGDRPPAHDAKGWERSSSRYTLLIPVAPRQHDHQPGRASRSRGRSSRSTDATKRQETLQPVISTSEVCDEIRTEVGGDFVTGSSPGVSGPRTPPTPPGGSSRSARTRQGRGGGPSANPNPHTQQVIDYLRGPAVPDWTPDWVKSLPDAAHRTANGLTAEVHAAVAAGWTPQDLAKAVLDRIRTEPTLNDVRFPAGLLRKKIADIVGELEAPAAKQTRKAKQDEAEAAAIAQKQADEERDRQRQADLDARWARLTPAQQQAIFDSASPIIQTISRKDFAAGRRPMLLALDDYDDAAASDGRDLVAAIR